METFVFIIILWFIFVCMIIPPIIQISNNQNAKATVPNLIHTKIVGVTKENVEGINIQKILPNLNIGDTVYLIREPNNPYDSNAIVCQCNLKHIGYISKELARELAPKIDSGTVISATITEITGGDDLSYGCNIAIRY